MGMSRRRTRATCNAVAVEIPAAPTTEENRQLRSGCRWPRTVADETKDKENVAPLGASFSGRTVAKASSNPVDTAITDTRRNTLLISRDLPNVHSALHSDSQASNKSKMSKKKRVPTRLYKTRKRLCNRSECLDEEGKGDTSLDPIEVEDGIDISQPKKAVTEDVSLGDVCNDGKEEYMSEKEDEEMCLKDSDNPTRPNPPSFESSELIQLQSAYDKLYKKYQNLKKMQYKEVDAFFDDQNLRVSAYVKASEALVEYLKRENGSLKQKLQESSIPEILNRSRWLEKVNAESKNDLVLERAKNLELRKHIKQLKEILLQKDPEDRTHIGKHFNRKMQNHFSSTSISTKDQDLTVDEAEIESNDANKATYIIKAPEISMKGGKPSVQLVLDVVKTLSNSLMESLPVMLSHPSVVIVCSCTVSAGTAFESHSMGDTKQPCTPQHLEPEQELHGLSVAIKKRDEKLQTLNCLVKLLKDLLEQLLGLKLTISSKGPARVMFLDERTGFSFILMSASDKYISDSFQDCQLLYQKVSLGALQKKAIDWMRENEFVFALSQVHVFFKRMLQTAHGGRGISFLEA